MSGSKKKKQCPYNEWVYCSDESCDCCGWYPGGRTKKKERKQPVKKQDSGGAVEEDQRKKQKITQADILESIGTSEEESGQPQLERKGKQDIWDVSKILRMP